MAGSIRVVERRHAAAPGHRCDLRAVFFIISLGAKHNASPKVTEDSSREGFARGQSFSSFAYAVLPVAASVMIVVVARAASRQRKPVEYETDDVGISHFQLMQGP